MTESQMVVTKRHLGDFEFVEILNAGDLHAGDPNCDTKMVEDAVAWVLEKPYRFMNIVGDILNAAIKSSVSDVYSSMTVDDSIDLVVRLLKPAAEAGKILCVLDGNHDRRVWKEVGLDPVKYVCHRLGIEYAGMECYQVLSLGNHNPRATDRVRPIHYAGYLTHGAGGGRTVGAKMNGVKQLEDIVNADYYVRGHVHQPAVFSSLRLVPDSQYRRIVEQEVYFISVGASLNRGGYAVAFQYPALPKTWPVLRLSGVVKKMSATM